MNVINSTKKTFNNITNSPAAKAWGSDFAVMGNDTLRILNATTVAGMRTTALTLRFTSITVETVNVGLGYALEKTPKTYAETKEAISSSFDNLMEMLSSEDEPEEIQRKPRTTRTRKVSK